MGFFDNCESGICSRPCSSRVNQELRSLDPETQVICYMPIVERPYLTGPPGLRRAEVLLFMLSAHILPTEVPSYHVWADIPLIIPGQMTPGHFISDQKISVSVRRLLKDDVPLLGD